ncbi:MAG: UDP-N-acetylmuramate dehydrogenase [Phycisphaerales bacterium]|nr:UDP-N-acetylmuramate dehydrogenase [Phycisphaerales bacterium]
MTMATDPLGSTTLFADLDVDVELDAPLAQHTWYGIGGSADALVRPKTPEALATLLRRCSRNAVRVRILGEGANLLVTDEGVEGVVVRLDAPCFKGLQLNANGPVTAARVGGGRDLGKTIRETVAAGLAGLEPLIGIPATIGGAVRMNAGGKYGAIGDTLQSVGLVDWNGEEHVYDRATIRCEYRHTDLPPGIVTWAVLALQAADPVALRARSKEISEYKASVQPLAAHSAGCMYKNPIHPATGVRISAGKVIDDAGLKGTRVGGALVSGQHGNFIVVEPGARAADVMELAALVAAETFARTGVRLEREVVFWRRGEA